MIPKMPTMSLAKKLDQRDAIKHEALIKGHGSTSPLLLEQRRVHATENVKNLMGFVQRLRAEHKAMIAREAEIEADFKARRQGLEGNPTPEHLAELDQFETARASRMYQALQLEIMAQQFMAQANVIDSNCLVFDALTVRMVKKKKNGKEGRYRQTVALTLFDLASYVQYHMEQMYPKEFPAAPESKEPDYEPEVDDEDIYEGEEEEGQDKNGV